MISLRNQIAIWIGVLLVSIFLLWMFRGILLPFVVGLALAYLLNPIVSALQRTGYGSPELASVTTRRFRSKSA